MLDELAANNGATTLALRRRLAAKAFARTAAYDAAISNWFADELKTAAPDCRAFGGRLIEALRYGENPHQTAASTTRRTSGPASPPRASFRARSFPTTISTTPTPPLNARRVRSARTAACVIIKHANPCGVAEGPDLVSAYRKALACDPTSAFGGIIALNRTLDAEAARNRRNLHRGDHRARRDRRGDRDRRGEEESAPAGDRRPARSARRASPRRPSPADFWCSRRDNAVVDDMELKVVTKRAPTEAELGDLKFAFRVAKHVKSNAIVYAKDRATVGIGAGQMSRVDSARIAARKAQDAGRRRAAEPLTKGSVVASDAFFPFADGLLACIEAGATAVIQPGGSIRDDEVIKAADEHGIAMVFTGIRHFRH